MTRKTHEVQGSIVIRQHCTFIWRQTESAYQRLVDSLLAREIGIDRYFSYIVTKTVKEETVLPVESLAE